MKKTIIEKVYELSQSHPDKVAVIADNREVCYGELFRLVSGYCHFLWSIGVKKGDIVIVKASQTTEYVVAYLAIHLSGAVVVAVEKNAPSIMIDDIANRMNASVIITNQLRFRDVVLENHRIMDCANNYFFDNNEFLFPDVDTISDIVFTTGTTGKSKGVMLTHQALIATAENLIYGCGYTSNTVVIVPGPLNHSNAIRKLQVSLYCGGAIYLLNGILSIESFYKALDYSHGRIGCCLPPSMVRKILQMSGNRIGEYDGKIDFIESASSPLPEVDKEKLCQLLPHTRLYNNYGSTESASACMYDYNQRKGMRNCVGKVLPNSKIYIVDENKNIIDSSNKIIGLIACAGAVNMVGYYNDENATKEVMNDGIVYTNDIWMMKGLYMFWVEKMM